MLSWRMWALERLMKWDEGQRSQAFSTETYCEAFWWVQRDNASVEAQNKCMCLEKQSFSIVKHRKGSCSDTMWHTKKQVWMCSMSLYPLHITASMCFFYTFSLHEFYSIVLQSADKKTHRYSITHLYLSVYISESGNRCWDNWNIQTMIAYLVLTVRKLPEWI